MNPWVAFIIGLLVGWLVEWIIDWFFWRRKEDDSVQLRADLSAAQSRISELEAQLKSARADGEQWRLKYDALDKDCHGRIDNLELEWQGKLAALEADNLALKADLDAASIRMDDLTRIEGIDADMATRLNAEGIYTYDDLVELEDADVSAKFSGPDWDGIDFGGWINGAKAGLLGLGAGIAGAVAGVFDGDDIDADLDIDARAPELDVDLDAPELDVDLPDADLDLDAPELDVDVPELDVDLDAPELDVDLPDADLDLDAPELDVDVPELDVDLDAPELDVDLPDADLDLDAPELDVDTRLPDVDVDLDATQLDFEAPSIDVDAPGLGIAAGVAGAAGLAARSGSVDVDVDTGPDNLKLIHGIGPRFQKKLNAAGIYRFSELAALEPDEVEVIIEPKDWQKFDYASWIAQAGELANKPQAAATGDDLLRIEGIGPKYNGLLRDAGVTTFAKLGSSSEADVEAIIQAPAWRNVNYGDWIAQAKLAAAGDEAGLKELQDQLNNRKKNNIRLLAGMGDKYATALEGAGFGTFDAIANASPDELAAVTGSAGLRAANFDEWIAEAKLRAAGKRVTRKKRKSASGGRSAACPQDLSAVEGIGRVYEQKLYAAGIGSYWELSELSAADLAEILEIENFQDVDLSNITADARRWAEETDSVGRVWDGTEPDDFEELEGIGEVYERRLYNAGICTFDALAALSEEQLAEIVQAPAMRRPNFASWLRVARRRVEEKGA